MAQAIFEQVQGLLEERRLLLRSGTSVDATIIAAPSSNWYFGVKLHIGTDRRGIVHTVRATDTGVTDVAQAAELLHGQEREVFGDQGYWKEDDRTFY